MKSATTIRVVVLTIIGVFIPIGTLDFALPTASSEPVLARPTFTSGPASQVSSTSATFAFTGGPRATFQCRLDALAFTACSSPMSYAGLAHGSHTFQVKAVSGTDRSAVTSYTWTVDTLAPPAPRTNAGRKGIPTPSLRTSGLRTSGLPFQIEGTVSALTLGTWKAVAVRISNPNGVVIHVSALKVAVATDSSPTGCLSSRNVELQQSNVSPSLTVAVPANGSVALPAQGVIAPQIRLKDLLTVNQDVCKNKRFTLTYSGTATS